MWKKKKLLGRLPLAFWFSIPGLEMSGLSYVLNLVSFSQ